MREILQLIRLRRIARRRLGLRPQPTWRDVVDSLLWRVDRWRLARRRGRALQRHDLPSTDASEDARLHTGDLTLWL